MSETPASPEEYIKIRNILDSIYSKVKNKERLQVNCRGVNGEALIEMVNDHSVPGLIYTLQPNRSDYSQIFNNTEWYFHSVGIISIGNNSYAVYDLTNPHSDTDTAGYFFETGTLKELSVKLSTRFGGDWDIDFNIDSNPELTVAGKIQIIDKKIKNGTLANVTISDITPNIPNILHTTVAAENKNIKKPLGLKYVPPPMTLDNSSPVRDIIRAKFTFEYA